MAKRDLTVKRGHTGEERLNDKEGLNSEGGT